MAFSYDRQPIDKTWTYRIDIRLESDKQLDNLKIARHGGQMHGRLTLVLLGVPGISAVLQYILQQFNRCLIWHVLEPIADADHTVWDQFPDVDPVLQKVRDCGLLLQIETGNESVFDLQLHEGNVEHMLVDELAQLLLQ